MKLYGAFSKVEEQDDGTIIVEGIASSETVDSDGEVVKASAIEAALPDYMRDGTGALREMHQPMAAGTATASVADSLTTIKAHVVDPVAVKKVKAGVYKGFSIGGKVTERDSVDKNTITGLRLVEISLVDRPANPDARLTMWKAEGESDDPVTPPAEIVPDTEVVVPQPPVVVEEESGKTAAEAVTLAKGLWCVSELAGILAALNSLQQNAQWEADMEGDGSTVPAQLREAVSTLSGILVAMVGEETEELTEDDDAADMLEMGAAPTDLVKVEANSEALAKMVSDAITKAIAPLNAEIERLKALPAAPKGVVNAVAVGKADDAGQSPVEKVEPVYNPDGTINEFATEIKKVHRSGGVR
jgi:uncharacterized small protein (DUF1192 family)